MDFEKELAADFDSDSDSFSEAEVSQTAAQPAAPTNSARKPATLAQLLENSHLANVGAKIAQLDVKQVADVEELSSVHALIPQIRETLARHADSTETDYLELLAAINHNHQSPEYAFLAQLSELPPLVSDEMALLHRYAAVQYRVVFSELELLVPSPVDYCKIVLEIGQDLAGIRAHEPRLRQIVAGDRVLAIVMAALQQFPLLFTLNDQDMAKIAHACTMCLELSSFLDEVAAFISQRLSKFAPNVSALIGPVATSQLLISTGSLKLLALTPSCNLPSFGVRDLLSQTKTHSNFVRATGYLYYCDLVKSLPPEIVKLALRILSGKVVLAARIDLSGSSPQAEMGEKYRLEVQKKIDQLLTPPDQAAVKALPVPKEQKSKKRGGRRFRKMKERFQMSDLRRAQNKMEFGKQEQTVMDTFGEEVGLGMSKQLEGILVNRNTDARISKKMVSRLQQQKERVDLDTIVAVPEKQPEVPWGRIKKRRLADLD